MLKKITFYLLSLCYPIKNSITFAVLTILTLATNLSGIAQDKWSVESPGYGFNYTSTPLTTDEGTWMSVDISPDGTKIVFDLLGDIFIMSSGGGKATPLRTGVPYEVQPRFSPNGKQILFTSDAGGGDNIWVMDSDGQNAKQITKESFRLLNNATWTPDGQYIIARKHFTSGRSLGAGEMWMYHITGGSGIQLTKRKNDQQDVNEPVVSPDGRYLYFSEDMYPGGFFQYNKDPNSQIYVIKRYDRESGRTQTIAGGNGSASRPVLSNDGKKLAFVKRVRTKSVLYVKDLETQAEWPLFDNLSKDQHEAWAIFGTYPNFTWSPDNEYIIIWAQGKINKINVLDYSVSNIPFEVNTDIAISEAVRFKTEAFEDTFTAKAIRHAITSPDGKWLIFNAAGQLWKKKLPMGTPSRITTMDHLEFEPAISPDGKMLTWVTWSDNEKGSIMAFEWQNRRAKPFKVTSEKGIFRTPHWNSDGTKITYQREGGNAHQGPTHTGKPGLYWIDFEEGLENLIVEEGAYPQFDKTGESIFYQTGGYFFGANNKQLKKVKLNGKNPQVIVKASYGNRIIPSPDEKWVSFINLHKVYIAPMPMLGKPLDLSGNIKSLPVSQVSRDAGINIHWSADSKKLHWTLGDEYFTNEIADRFTFLTGSPSEVPAMDTTGIKIGLELTTDKPEGTLVFTNASIITMVDETIIENGVVVIEDNIIKAVGGANTSYPSDATVIDLEGKYVMPGLFDAHAHLGQFRYGLSPEKHWEYYTNLAFGVTSTHDPSSNTEMVFSQSEMVKRGLMVGPRIFSTGIILYGADGDFKAVINSLEDARAAIRRTKAFGAFSVKSYNQPRREQRQQVLQAAREQNVMVVPEGGSTFFHNMSMVMDGHTTVEHNFPIAPVYKDVKTLWENGGTAYTPTLIVNYAGMSGEYYWYQTTNVYENEHLLKYTPRSVIDSRSRHRTMVPMEEYDNGHILTAETCKALTDLGVDVNSGAHGQIQGLGMHWEIWMMAQGGMSNYEALKTGTINPAKTFGMDHQLGTLETGKLADIIVLDGNPLEDIKNTNTVTHTMVNGRLFDVSTMNEIGRREKARTPFWWELDEYYQEFDWHADAHSHTGSGCVCGR